VEEWVVAAGLSGKIYLGLSVEQWLDVAISALVAILVSLLALWGVKLLLRAIKRASRETDTEVDDAVLEVVGNEVRWLVVVWVVRFALLRLGFWSEGLRVLIDDPALS
jgi:hypothetical protein